MKLKNSNVVLQRFCNIRYLLFHDNMNIDDDDC